MLSPLDSDTFVSVIQKNAAGLRVVLPLKNPKARRTRVRSFASHYSSTTVGFDPSGRISLALLFQLGDLHFYRYYYVFSPDNIGTTMTPTAEYWQEQVSTSFALWQPAALFGGEAYNRSVRPLLSFKTFVS